jgi:uracil-DNA glycosylase
MFVGSNPSAKSETTSPFDVNTNSGRVLKSWIDRVGIQDYSHINVSDEKTPGNRPLSISEIKKALGSLSIKLQGADRVVAVGKTAAKAMDMTGIAFMEIPHPSGLNRKLNDPQFVEEQLEKLKKYVE